MRTLKLAAFGGLILSAGTGAAMAADCDPAPVVVDNSATFIVGAVVLAGDTFTCHAAAPTLVVPTGTYGVFRVTSRGAYILEGDDEATYRVEVDGVPSDTSFQGDDDFHDVTIED